jgi:hypothetical protein
MFDVTCSLNVTYGTERNMRESWAIVDTPPPWKKMPSIPPPLTRRRHHGGAEVNLFVSAPVHLSTVAAVF